MSTQTPTPTKTKLAARRGCRSASLTGTNLTDGQPIRRRIRSGKDMGDGRTTRALSKQVIGRANAARLWLTKAGEPMELTPFLEDAVNASVRSVLASNPDFKLPAWCAFNG
jgi:hypothetical protein